MEQILQKNVKKLTNPRICSNSKRAETDWQSGKFGGSNILEPASNILEPQNFIFNNVDRNEQKKLW